MIYGDGSGNGESPRPRNPADGYGDGRMGTLGANSGYGDGIGNCFGNGYGYGRGDGNVNGGGYGYGDGNPPTLAMYNSDNNIPAMVRVSTLISP